MAKVKEIAVTRKGKTGLSGEETKEVLSAIRSARGRGQLPAMSYEYNPHPRIFGKDPIYLIPKNADVKRTGVKVRAVLRQRFGDKYSVYLT